MKSFLTIILTTVLFSALAQEIRISLDGMVLFNESGITINDAGNDFAVTLESETSLYASVVFNNNWDKRINPNSPWRVEVHKSDYNWNNNLVLETMRAGNGFDRKNRNKAPKINDGTNYQTVTNMSSYFFSGRDEIVEIPVKFRIRGLSVVNGAQDFETKIILTIYDN